MQTLKLLSLSLLLAGNPASADESFRPAEWFQGILEKTAADSVTSFQWVNGNLVGISLTMDKAHFLFYTNHKILEQKMICIINGKETDVFGK